MSMISLIFDLDGTLIDTAKATVPACMAGAARFGLAVLEPACIRQMIGWANPEFYDRLYPDVDPDLRELFAAAVEIDETSLIRLMGPDILFAGISELLAALAARGYYMAIASTGSIGHVEASLAASGIAGYFAEVHCSRPDKEEMVAAIRQKDPDATWLLVGDKSKDARAARANRILSVGARYGFGSDNEMSQFDQTIETPLDLLMIVDQFS